MITGPLDVVDRHGASARFGAGRKHGADRHVVGPSRDCSGALIWCVGRQADPAPRPLAGKFPNVLVARVKEIFLTQMNPWGPDLHGDLRMVIDHQTYLGITQNRCQRSSQLKHLRFGKALSPELDQV